jgi:glycine reductase complex component B subunit gamma
VQICTITSIAMAVGANRIVPAYAIPHPLGNPELSLGQEKILRRKLVDRALAALESSIDDQTLFNA